MKLIANTIRMVDYDQAKEYAFGDYSKIHKKLAICFINSENFSKLGLKEGLNLSIKGKYGEVVMYCQEKEGVPKNMILIPVSIWANQITGIEENQIIYKNFQVEVERTSSPVLKYKDLIKKFLQK